MIESNYEVLLAFFKVMSDANRLKIVGLLLNSPMSVDQIASSLNVSAGTASHHLKKLSEVGLVSAIAEQYYHIYHLNPDRLKHLANTLLDGNIQQKTDSEIGITDYDSAILKTFFVDGKLTKIPVQHKKRLVILKKLIEDFEWDRNYSEKELNQVLLEYHWDSATLRREFIAWKMMQRSDGIYRRVESEHGARTGSVSV